MSSDLVAGVIPVLICFGVLVGVALVPREPARRGRHRRDLLGGAR